MNWESILTVVSHPIVVTVVTAIAGVAVAGFVKYKKAFKAMMDIPRRVVKARSDKSPGGKNITAEEYAQIGKEIVELAEAVAKLDLFKRGK